LERGLDAEMEAVGSPVDTGHHQRGTGKDACGRRWWWEEIRSHTRDNCDADSARLQRRPQDDGLMLFDGVQEPPKRPPDAPYDPGQVPRNFTKHLWATAHFFSQRSNLMGWKNPRVPSHLRLPTRPEARQRWRAGRTARRGGCPRVDERPRQERPHAGRRM
jgi:hypothetical protein